MADNSEASSSTSGGSGASAAAASSAASKLNATAKEFKPRPVDIAPPPPQQQQGNAQMEQMMHMQQQQQNNPVMMNNYGYGYPPNYAYFQAFDGYSVHPNQYPRSNNPRPNKHHNNNNNNNNDRNQPQNSNTTANGSTSNRTEETGNNTNIIASSNAIGGYKDVFQKGYLAAVITNEKAKPNGTSSSTVTVIKAPAVAPISTNTNVAEVVRGDSSVAPDAPSPTVTDTPAPKVVVVDTTAPNTSVVATTNKEENTVKKSVSIIDPVVANNNAATNESDKWRRTTLSVESTASTTSTTSAPITPANSWSRGERLTVTSATLLERNDGIIRYDKNALLAVYAKGKDCPPEIRIDYPYHSLEERAPAAIKATKASNNSQGNRRNDDDPPHPDEVLIFSQENLKNEAAFHYDASRLSGDMNDPEVIIRKATLILNKLSVTKFDKLSDEFMSVGLDTPELMQKAVEIIVSKAQMEEHFCFMYADLCRKITDKWTVQESGEGNTNTSEDAITDELGKAFRNRLLGRCEEEFNVDRVKELEIIRNNSELTVEMKDEQEMIAKKRYIGHMRFIGEIYMKELIKKVTIESCIDELQMSTDEDTLVCLVKLIQTIGAKFEKKSSGKAKMSEYFKSIDCMSKNNNMSLRIRFMMKDLIDMRHNGWSARRETEKAKTLDEIRAETDKNFSKGGMHKVKSGDNLSSRSAGTPKGNGSQDARSGWGTNASDEWSTVTKGKTSKSSSNAASPKGGKTTSSVKFSNTPANTTTNAKEKGKFGKEKKELSKDKKAFEGSAPATILANAESVPSVSLRRERGPSLAGFDLELSVGKETISRIKACLEEYLANRAIKDLIVDLREIIHPNSYHEVVRTVILLTFDKKEKDRETLIQSLLYELVTNEHLFTGDQVRRGVQFILNDIDDILIDSPNALIYLCETLGYLVTHGIVPLLVLNHTSPYYEDSDMYIRCCKKDAIIVNTLSNIYKYKCSLSGVAAVDSKMESVEMSQYVVDLYDSSGISFKDVINYNEKRQSIQEAIREIGVKYGLSDVLTDRLQT